MKKDEYSFLEIFGGIDDEYIVQALQPWKRQTGIYMAYHIGKKAACLTIIVMLGFCLAFHDQVYAAISRFTTMIAEILQIPVQSLHLSRIPLAGRRQRTGRSI